MVVLAYIGAVVLAVFALAFVLLSCAASACWIYGIVREFFSLLKRR